MPKASPRRTRSRKDNDVHKATIRILEEHIAYYENIIVSYKQQLKELKEIK